MDRPVSDDVWKALFEIELELNGKTEASSILNEDSFMDFWYDSDPFEDALAAAKVALLRKCDYCGRRTEGHCCAEVPLEGDWSLL